MMGLFLSKYEKFDKGLPDVTGKVFVITGKLVSDIPISSFSSTIIPQAQHPVQGLSLLRQLQNTVVRCCY
jgi:hypothetical protein